MKEKTCFNDNKKSTSVCYRETLSQTTFLNLRFECSIYRSNFMKQKHTAVIVGIYYGNCSQYWQYVIGFKMEFNETILDCVEKCWKIDKLGRF